MQFWLLTSHALFLKTELNKGFRKKRIFQEDLKGSLSRSVEPQPRDNRRAWSGRLGPGGKLLVVKTTFFLWGSTVGKSVKKNKEMMIIKVKIEFTSRKESEGRKSFQGGDILFFDLSDGDICFICFISGGITIHTHTHTHTHIYIYIYIHTYMCVFYAIFYVYILQ